MATKKPKKVLTPYEQEMKALEQSFTYATNKMMFAPVSEKTWGKLAPMFGRRINGGLMIPPSTICH
jgi:hypothetical protein